MDDNPLNRNIDHQGRNILREKKIIGVCLYDHYFFWLFINPYGKNIQGLMHNDKVR